MAGLLGSLYNGNTGLHAASIGVSVTGDNIANTNTVGFKASRAHFQDLVSEFLVGTTGANQAGRGVALQRIEKLFTQGSLIHTGVPTDLSIRGDGFFILNGAGENRTENLYTRAGQFRFDDEGFMISQAGHRVQGFNADTDGDLSAVLDGIQVNRKQLDPRATSEIDLFANLRPDDPTFANGFDVNDPENSSSFRTTIVLFDSLGNGHEMTVYGTKTADNTWQMTGVVDGEEVAGGQAGQPVEIDLGQLQFDQDGLLQSSTTPDPVNIPWVGANAGAITFDFGDPIADGGSGRAGSSQWNRVNESAVNFLHQDGYGTGQLENIGIDDNGLITGAFSNGQTLVLAQVAMATFEDPTELTTVGGNNFVETANSGAANIGTARTAGRGAMTSGALEAANVELSDQFIDLIAYQRAFQGNSKTIQTADNLLQEVFQLLR